MARKKNRSLEKCLRAAFDKISKKAVREPRTAREVADRLLWERLRKIVWRRYEVRGFEQETVSRVQR
jgi:hypothetical protein